ncbi:ubiquitin-associated protein 2-like isoform X2 [Lineus longissimus]|uniref:ubiquitin-associated protein 2-like isoform X2 n=1 Tax=Lineus longissimus TaxID=88925 RepID=UPI00315CA4A9
MSASSTSRANRSSKEKTTKTQPQQTQIAKDGTAKAKATAEQMRYAQMMGDKQSVEDPELQQKVMQLMDLTQKSHDEVVIALHDCDNDANRASIMLLEGDNDQGEWQETGKKRKRGAPPVNNQIPEQTNSKPEFTNRQQPDKREKSNDREFKEQSHRSESSSRGRRRDDGPPRFQRGGKASSWRGKENEENERNRAESKGRDNRDNRDRDMRDGRDNRERSFERGRGRGRGGRGRGRGRGGGMDRGGDRGDRIDRSGMSGAGSTGSFDRGLPRQGGGFDSGPHIDTWTNDQAVVERSKSGWENMVTEDWNDDWTGSNAPEQNIHVNSLDSQFNLNETTVFTASSTIGAGRKPDSPPSEPFGQNGTLGQSNSLSQGGIIGQSNSLGHGTGDRSPIQTGAIGSNSLSQSSAIGQPIGGTNSLTGSLGLGALLQQKPSSNVADIMTSSQANSSQTMTLSQSQFSKQATDALKSIVGIGTSPSSTSQPVQMPPSLSSGVTMPGSASTSQHSQSPPQGHGRPKPARSKLPPPSKIPASAVEMPGHMTTSLDVQFGFMTDFGSTNTCSESTMSSTFTNSNAVSTTGSAMTNHLPLTSQTAESSATTVSLMTSITPPKTSLSTVEQSTTRTSMFSSSANTTPTKDYSQSSMTKSSGISAPEPIPFPSSQGDRPKTSPLMTSQRPTTGSLTSSDPVSTYAQSSYSSSSYPSRYQPHKSTPLTSSGYTHGTNSLTTHPSTLQQIPSSVAYQQNQYQSQSQYATSSFQGQTGFSAGPSQGSLYQSTNQPSYGPSSSAYRDNQTGASSYTSGQSASAYPSSPSTGSSYQSSHSQSAGYGGGQTTTYPTCQSSPYPQTQTAPSYQTSQTGSYPSSQSYSNVGQTGSSAYPSNQTNSYQSASTGASGQSSSAYPTTQASSFPSTQASAYPTTQASSYTGADSSSYPSGQSGSRYQTGQSSSQSASSYPGGASSGQSASSYPSGQSSSALPQTGSSYPTAQSTSSYPTTVTVTQSSAYSLSHPGSTNQTYGSHSNYNSSGHQTTLQTSPMSTTKLNESLSKMTVKDTGLDQSQTSYDAAAVSSTATLSSTTITTSSSLAAGSVSVSTSLGITPMTSAVTSISPSTTKSSTLTNAAGTTGKAPPNLPPGVPPALLGPNFIMGQHMAPYFGLTAQGLTAQQPPAMYAMNSYEDLQLLQQQRLPLPGYYDGSLPFQPPTSLATGADQRQLGSVPYSGADGKLSRVDAQSPVQGSQTSQQQPSQSAHQQYINPAATLPPGYGYYIAQTGLMPGGFSYTPQMFQQQVPVTNAAHGNTTATTQFQKPAAYAAASHGYGTASGYEDLMQAQDYSKTGYGGVSQTQNKVSVTSGIKVGGVNTTSTDLAAAAYTAKSHAQSFDKQGFHAGTPPPFNMPVAGGSQAGPMGAPTTPYASYMPILQHQPQAQMLHHQLQQDSTGSARSQPSSNQPKAAGSSKNYSTGYWNA